MDRRPILPDHLVFMEDVVYATVEDHRGEPVELTMNTLFARNNENETLPVVVYIHGGGYSGGSKDDATTLLVPFAKGGYLAVAIDYRLSGMAPYPAAVHDCKAAVRFLRANADDLGIDPQRIGAFGHSAGGQLAAFLAVTGDDEQFAGDVGPTDYSSALQCAVDISGPADFKRLGDQHPTIIDQYFAGPPESLDARLIEASTVTHVDGEDPPLLIIHGEADRVVPIDHSEQLRDAYEQSGAEVQFLPVKGAGHVVRERSVYREIARFFDLHLGGDAEQSMMTPDPDRVIGRGEAGRRPVDEDPKTAPPAGPVLDEKPEPEDEPEKPEKEPGGDPTTQPDDAPADESSAAALPSGLSTPEGAACDLARAFINEDWSLFDETCLDARGDEYTAFLDQMKQQFEAQAEAEEPSPFGPRRITRVYKARHLSRNGPSSAAHAVYRFNDLQFVDVVAEMHDGSEHLVRTLVVKKDGRWKVIPDPSSFPLLSVGLNDEPPSTEEYDGGK